MTKTVQIAVAVIPGMDNATEPAMGLFALREDGTIWFMANPGPSGWWQQVENPGEQIGFPPDRYWTAVDALKKTLGDKYAEARAIVSRAGGRLS